MVGAGLEEYYKGDAAWRDFAAAVENEIGICPLKESIEKSIPDSDLANVICFLVGSHSLEWINKQIPALDGMTPVECMNSEAGIRRLKAALMRMP